MRLKSLTMLIFGWGALGTLSFGQLDRGSLSGTISDPSGAAVPGASVTTLQTSTQVSTSTVTNNAGAYSFSGLAVGDYTVTLEIAGFKKMIRTGVKLIGGANVRLDLVLELGTVNEQVEVQSAAPVVETRDSAYGVSVLTKTLEELPLQVSGGKRNINSFLATVPGVINPGGLNNIMGGVGLYSQVVVDGIGAEYEPLAQGIMYRPLSVEVISEFRVVNSVNAEYGPTGGAFISFVSSSGTNSFHGNIYEYFRNDALNARTFFAGAKARDKQNEFGFTAGGPLVIPKLYNGRNKTFFFGNFTEYITHGTLAGQVYTLPTTPMRSGDFSALLGPQIGTDALGRPVLRGQIYDSTTTRPFGAGFIRDPFPGNMIPASRFSSVSDKLQGFYPTVSNNNLTNNYVGSSQLRTSTEKNLFVRIDQQIGKGRLYGTYKLSIGDTVAPIALPDFFAGRGVKAYDIAQSARLAYTRTLGASAVIDSSLGFDRGNPDSTSNDTALQGATLIGLKNYLDPCTPQMTIEGGYPFMPGGCSYLQHNAHWHYNLSLSKIVGKHTMKFGVSHIRWNTVFRVPLNGVLTFAGQETNLPGFQGNTGFGYASFLLGEVDSALLSENYSTRLLSNYTALFAQDEYRLTPKLTLNYGLRYEIQPQFRGPLDDSSQFNPTIANSKAGGRLGALEFLGFGPGRNGRSRFGDTEWLGFAPRVGFAYLLRPKTVIRGSYGIYHAPVSQFDGYFTNRQGFHPSYSFASSGAGLAPAFNWTPGYPVLDFSPRIDPTVANGNATAFLGKDSARPGQIQLINFNVQQELPGQIALEIAYLANFSHHIGTNTLQSINQLDYATYGSLGSLLLANISSPAAVAAGIPLPYPGFTGSVAQALRPYPQYLGINGINATIGDSIYHALQLKAQKHYSNGLSFLVGYTWSKNLTNVNQQPGRGAAGIQDAYNYRAEWAVMTNDYPHNLVASYAYELPFGPGKKFRNQNDVFSKYVLGSWNVSGILSYYSGGPLSIATNQRLPATSDLYDLGNLTLRPNRVLGVSAKTGLSCAGFDPATDLYLNRGAFLNPAPFTFGNTSPRLSDVRGCGFANENISLLKLFPVKESFSIRFGADFFNIFNRKHFGNPATNIDNANFGRISTAGPSRIIQFNLKVLW